MVFRIHANPLKDTKVFEMRKENLEKLLLNGHRGKNTLYCIIKALWIPKRATLSSAEAQERTAFTHRGGGVGLTMARVKFSRQTWDTKGQYSNDWKGVDLLCDSLSHGYGGNH